MSREAHVRFWEGAGVKSPRATQLWGKSKMKGAAKAPHCGHRADLPGACLEWVGEWGKLRGCT